MNGWEFLSWALGTIVAGIGGPVVAWRLVRRTLERWAGGATYRLLRADREVRRLLDELLTSTDSDRVILIRTGNGVDVARTISTEQGELYCTIEHEASRPGVEKLGYRWVDRPVDSTYRGWLRGLVTSRHDRLVVTEMADSALKTEYLAVGVQQGDVIYVGCLERPSCFVYVSVHFPTPRELGPRQHAAMELAATKLLQQLIETPQVLSRPHRGRQRTKEIR